MFKVGDIVIFKNCNVSNITHQIDFITSIGFVCLDDVRGQFKQDDLQHATPEEIAAGHRIDTNTGVTVITPSGINKVKGGITAFINMGDDSHIENHVSPNCKKFDERVR